MSETVAFRPVRGGRLSRFLAVSLTVALVIAIAVTVSMLVAAVRDNGDATPNRLPATEIEPHRETEINEHACRPTRVVTPC